jgi:pimeloyl-ACP methyl ester carboxylesterase
VLSFALGETDQARTGGGGASSDGLDASFDPWRRAIDAILDRACESRACLAGVSFGGVIAASYAAHRAGRVSALVLISSPSPAWRLDERSAAFLRHPWIALPAFSVRACWRLAPEIIVAKSTWGARIRFGLEYAGRAIRAPLSPVQMAEWVRRWMASSVAADCRRIIAPTLLLTGEPHLDRVVEVASTLEYLALIPGARHAVLSGTGHVGLVSKPDEFARLVSDFIREAASAAATGDQVPFPAHHAS